MSYDKRFKRFQEFVEDAGGAPANSAGAGGVAGIGQPPGSAFGEHPQQATALGGATTKTKKKNKRPVGEGIGDWVKGKTMSDRDAKAVVANAKAALSVYPDKLLPQLKRLLHDVGTGQPNAAAVARLRQFLRDNGMVYEEPREPVIEWDQVPKPIEGGEQVTEERETFAGSPVFEVDTDAWMKSRFGKNRYHRYSKYVGEGGTGEKIRQHGRTQRKDDIILKDQATGAMTWFLRRKKTEG
jgi:hypothetical protein